MIEAKFVVIYDNCLGVLDRIEEDMEEVESIL